MKKLDKVKKILLSALIFGGMSFFLVGMQTIGKEAEKQMSEKLQARKVDEKLATLDSVEFK